MGYIKSIRVYFKIGRREDYFVVNPRNGEQGIKEAKELGELKGWKFLRTEESMDWELNGGYKFHDYEFS